LTIASKRILTFAFTLALLGGASTALAAPTLGEVHQDAPHLQQRSALTPLDQITTAQRFAKVNEFLVFASAKQASGILPSRYTGAFYRPHLEQHRICIVKRESSGRYSVVSSGGRYFGAYQMTKELGVGATWMMLPEHKKLLGVDVAKTLLAGLRKTPVNEWPRYWQDAAFSTIHNWERDRSGAHHWRGVRSPC
jgi:hypothetical protein